MTRFVVTGAAGFIGSNIVKGLNQRGIDDIIAVDDLTQGDKFRNLADLKIADYVDLDLFYDLFAEGFFGKVEAVFHEGACSDTMETDGKYMMDNNYTLSCGLFKACQERGSRLLYASSAATYGGSQTFRESPQFEHPLNVYGYSKLLFDQRMRRECGQDFKRVKRQVAGFRYFNVYGPREQHKGRMASVAFHQFNQFRAEGKVKLFGEYGGYGPGEQKRDFVFVDDVVAVNLWFLDHPEQSGIFNLGTGRAQPFNDVAVAVVNALRPDASAARLDAGSAARQGLIEYVPFPDALRGKYQCFTQADLTALRAAGCDHVFADVQTGVASYMASLWPRARAVNRCALATVSSPSHRRCRRRRVSSTHQEPIMWKKILVILAMLYAAASFAAVDVNKATAAELDGIKGIGPAISGKIIDERKKGPYKDWQDFIDRVKGVGEGNAAKFSAEGLTVNGSTYKGVAATKKDEKSAAKEEKKATPTATKDETKDAKATTKEEKKEAKAAAKEAKAEKTVASASAAKPAASAAKTAASAKK